MTRLFCTFLFACGCACLPITPALALSPDAQATALDALARKIDAQNTKIDALSQQILKLQQEVAQAHGNSSSSAAGTIPAAAATSAPAAETTSPAPAPAANGATHVVTRGETLTSIAHQHKVSVSELQKINHIANDRTLQIGQTLVLPGAPTASPSASPNE